MKKVQRILAILGVILLLSMYGSTLVFALSGSPDSTGWFKASIYCTVVVPVLLYAYTMIYKYLKNRNHPPDLMDKDEKKTDLPKTEDRITDQREDSHD